MRLLDVHPLQVGEPFSADSLSIVANGASDMNNWTFGQVDDGNLLGTIRSLDQLGVVSLNCTENANITVHAEELHCEWGVVSRNGWAVINDTGNQALSEGTRGAQCFRFCVVVDAALASCAHSSCLCVSVLGRVSRRYGVVGRRQR